MVAAEVDDQSDTIAPLHKAAFFDPAAIVGCPPQSWVDFLLSMATALPIQMHMEPQVLGESGGPPLFRRAEAMIRTIPELDFLISPGLSETGKQKTGRMKFRLSGTGKFVHRNRFRRRNVVCCLHGTSHWLFVESSSGVSDTYLNASTNDNWNGFRSNAFPSTLSLEQMHTIAADMTSQGVRAHVQRFTAGDILTFDGRWWHATNYTAPVLNMFLTSGKDGEVALREHNRRMKMPMQKGLHIASINTAKVAMLSKNWQQKADGSAVNWAEVPNGDVDYDDGGD